MKSGSKIIVLVLLLSFTACTSHFRMTTRVHRDGTVERSVYAFADSAFRAGDRSTTPFLFLLDANWQVTCLDSFELFDSFGEKQKVNVKVSRSLKGAEDMLFFTPKEEWMRSLVAPQEKLEKHFRWFYTYYTYSCSFGEITEKGPVSMDKYLTKQEQRLLFQGDLNGCVDMNGIELSEKLNQLTTQFQQWLYQTQFELAYGVVEQFLDALPDTVRLSQIRRDKMTVFAHDKTLKDKPDCSPEYICKLLDGQYGGDFFTEMYKARGEAMDKEFEKRGRIVELFANQIKFELAMPGKLIAANTQLTEDNQLIWKVDGYRLLPGEYVLKAESRTANVWTFWLTGVLLLFIGYVLIKKRK